MPDSPCEVEAWQSDTILEGKNDFRVIFALQYGEHLRPKVLQNVKFRRNGVSRKQNDRRKPQRKYVGLKSKPIHRDEVRGLFHHPDIQSGAVSVNALRARMHARQAAINEAHKKDWSDPNTVNSPAYGNALTRLPKPSDYVVR